MTIRDILSRCDNDNMIIFIIRSSGTITRIYNLSDQELSLHFDRYSFGIYFDQMSITFKIFD